MKNSFFLLVCLIAVSHIGNAQKAEGVMKNAAITQLGGQVLVYPYRQAADEKSFKGIIYNQDLSSKNDFEIPVTGVLFASFQKEGLGDGVVLKANQSETSEDYTLAHLDRRISNYKLEKLNKTVLSENIESYRNYRNYMYAGFEVKNSKNTQWSVDVWPGEKNFNQNLYARLSGAGDYKGAFCIVGGMKDKSIPGLYLKKWTVPIDALKNMEYKITQAGIDTVAVWLTATNAGKTTCRLMVIQAITGQVILNKEILNPESPAYVFSQMIYDNGQFYAAGVYAGLSSEASKGTAEGYFIMKIDLKGKVQEKRIPITNDGMEVLKATGARNKSMVIHGFSIVRNEIHLIGENIGFKGAVPVVATYALGVVNPTTTTQSDEAYTYGFTFAKFDLNLDIIYSKFTPIASEATKADKLVTSPCKCTDMANCAALVPGVNNGASAVLTDGRSENIIYRLGKNYYQLFFNGEEFFYVPIRQLVSKENEQNTAIIPGDDTSYYAFITNVETQDGYIIYKIPFAK